MINKALELCRDICQEKIPPFIGHRLGYGEHGEVYEMLGFSDRVYKFSVSQDRQQYLDTLKVLSFLIKNPHPSLCKVFDVCIMKENKYSFLYYSVMERLLPLTEDENKVFHSLLSHEDRNLVKAFSSKKINEMIVGLKMGLDFNAPKVAYFCKQVQQVPIFHKDISQRNIMKDVHGNFKLIDFDLASIK